MRASVERLRREAKGSPLLALALYRRRVHKSWKITSISAFCGGLVLSSAGLLGGAGFLLVIVVLLLLRPAFEVYFSARAHCPHCGADVFMDLCQKESQDGIESGLVCPYCGRDATKQGADPSAMTVDV
ncbi:hypothetical protein [Rubritalea marina]|uniref:hypothetical protein n=1 Tax=Rubritalea marina TaxID=361055 RepID=UPI0012EA03B5|nr:hypothetical protein [Rubritalea marina]